MAEYDEDASCFRLLRCFWRLWNVSLDSAGQVASTVFFTSALPSLVALSLLACQQLVDKYNAELHVIITLHMWQ